MSYTSQPGPSSADAVEDPRPFVAWFFLLGVVLIVLGAVALAHTAIVGQAVVWLLGVLLLIGGTMHIFELFLAAQWRGYLLHAVAAVTDLVLGLILVLKTDKAEEIITLLLAVIYFVAGSMRSWTAAMLRFHGWIVAALSGLVTLL